MAGRVASDGAPLLATPRRRLDAARRGDDRHPRRHPRRDPPLARGVRLARGGGGGGAARAGAAGAARGGPGLVLATPASGAVDGATVSTQFGAATLTPGAPGALASSLDALGGSLVAGATQAALPPWLRRSAADADGGFEATLAAATLAASSPSGPPRRRLGREGADSDAATARTPAGGSSSRGDRSSILAMAERRRRIERERALRRRHAVTLVRAYRAGELPDVRGVTPAALLDPLAALALRDQPTAAALLTALADAALAADDARAAGSNFGAGRKRARERGNDRDASENKFAPPNANACGPLRAAFRAALRDLLPAAASDASLASWALQSAAADPAAGLDADVARRVAFESGRVADGVLALEARALYLAGIDAAEDGAFSDRRRVQTLGAAKRMKRAETASPTRLPEMPSPSTPALARPLASEPSTIWSALAALHRAAGDDAWYRLSLREGPLADDSATRDAVAAQLRGDARRAGDAYDALLADPTRDRTRPRARALDPRASAVFAAARGVGRRAGGRRAHRGRRAVDRREAPPRVGRGRARALPGAAAGGGALAAAVRATLRVASSLDDPAERAALVAKNLAPILADRRASPGSSGGFVAEELGVELALLRALDGAEDSAATHVADVRRTFRLAWVRSHPRAVLTRRVLLQPLQCATELEEMLDAARFARARRDASSPSDALRAFAETLERWRRRWPSDALDPPEVWERVAFARARGAGRVRTRRARDRRAVRGVRRHRRARRDARVTQGRQGADARGRARVGDGDARRGEGRPRGQGRRRHRARVVGGAESRRQAQARGGGGAPRRTFGRRRRGGGVVVIDRRDARENLGRDASGGGARNARRVPRVRGGGGGVRRAARRRARGPNPRGVPAASDRARTLPARRRGRIVGGCRGCRSNEHEHEHEHEHERERRAKRREGVSALRGVSGRRARVARGGGGEARGRLGAEGRRLRGGRGHARAARAPRAHGRRRSRSAR